MENAKQIPKQSLGLEADRNSTTDPVVGDDLESGVVDQDRQVDRDFGANFSKVGADARTEKDGSDASIFRGLALPNPTQVGTALQAVRRIAFSH